jgi:hypothetical protein
MRPHWNDLVVTLEVLARMVKDTDKYGLDLIFMIPSENRKGEKDVSKLANHARKHKPLPDERKSNINNALGEIISEYRGNLGRSPKQVRPMTLYILTDGVWQPEEHVAHFVGQLVKSLDDHHRPPNQFGIQFIQFGNDYTGTQRLKFYDEGICRKYGITR